MKTLLMIATLSLSLSAMANDYVIVDCKLGTNNNVTIKRNNKGVTVSVKTEGKRMAQEQNVVSATEMNTDFNRDENLAEIVSEIGDVSRAEIYEISREDSQEKMFSLYQGKSLKAINIYQNSFLGRVNCQ